MVEVGIWFQTPGAAPESIVPELMANDVLSLEPGGGVNFEPVSLGEITADSPRGIYVLGCRVIDPVTKELRYESIQPAAVQ